MMMKKKKVTFDDIARYTHFSKTTISRYFNDPDSLTEEHQQTIREALVALDYQENKVAKILAKGKTEFVGVIVPNLYLHYFSEILNQILQTYEQYGYKFLVFVGNQHKDIEKQYIRELMSYQIEGLLVMSHTIPSADLAALNIPIVSIEREDQYISSVNCDDYMGAVQAVSLLTRKKCDIYIHINARNAPHVPAYKRYVGFCDFCKEHNLPYALYTRDMGDDYETAKKIMGEIFEEIDANYQGKRKGIFFSDDTRANCFENLLLRKYKTIPPDYQLVGFDNSPVSREAVYTISTVGQQIDVIANEAVSLLISQIEEFKASKGKTLPKPVHKVVTPVLLPRETTEMN